VNLKRLIGSMLRVAHGRNRPRRLPALVFACAVGGMLATASIAQPAKPPGGVAVAPTTQPATTPKEALRQLNAAMRDGDRERIRTLMDARTTLEASMVDAMASMAEALAGLQRASTKAFGADGAKDVTGDDGSRWAEGLARIESADVKLSGDIATVTYRAHAAGAAAATPAPRPGLTPVAEPKSHPSDAAPGPATRPSAGSSAGAGSAAATPDRAERSEPITLRRVNGVWRMPVSQLAPGVDQPALEQRLAELAVQADLVREITAEIEAAKFTTSEQAADSWHSRFMQSLGPKPATSQGDKGTKAQGDKGDKGAR
jgi:hypothetical protein